MVYFVNEVAARQNGWVITTDFSENKLAGPDRRYKAMAEHEMGGMRKVFQTIFVKFAVFISCGYALKIDQFKHWNAEIEKGKIISEIYCETLTSDYVPKGITSQPEIVSDNWGEISLKLSDGTIKQFKDVIILPSDSRGEAAAEEWNWGWDHAEPMHHEPGIRPKDIDHLIFSGAQKPDVVILSTGRGHGGQRVNPGPGVLKVMPGVEKYIKDQGVSEVWILKTPEAVEKYNELRKQDRCIAALIHTTC